MRPAIVAICLSVAAFLSGVAVEGGFRHPAPAPSHAIQVSKAQHAFCNCMKSGAYLQECLGSAETGEGHEVNDQELLLSRCLEQLPARARPTAE